MKYIARFWPWILIPAFIAAAFALTALALAIIETIG